MACCQIPTLTWYGQRQVAFERLLDCGVTCVVASGRTLAVIVLDGEIEFLV